MNVPPHVAREAEAILRDYAEHIVERRLRTPALIARVQEAARSGANLMPHILAAVEAFATVGEISDAMRKVFGEYQEAVVI